MDVLDEILTVSDSAIEAGASQLVVTDFESAVLSSLQQTNILLCFLLCFTIVSIMLMVRKKKG